MSFELITAAQPPRLEGQKVRLVPMTLEHLGRLTEIGLDPKLWVFTTIALATREQMESYVRKALQAQQDGTCLPFVIVERSTEQIVGATRYHSIVPDQKRLEIGFTWIAPPWQRTSVNTEAKYLLLRYAFERLGCVRVEFKANVANDVSRKALERIGAKQEGVLRNYRVSPDGRVFDLVMLSMIVEEWPQIRSELERKLEARGDLFKIS